MTIDIESLSYEELLELNHIIVERLKFLDAMNTQQQMMQFNPGDEVSFAHPSQGRQTGTLLKYNKKTVTILTKSGQKWNVSPHLLRKIIQPKKSPQKAAKVLELTKSKKRGE